MKADDFPNRDDLDRAVELKERLLNNAITSTLRHGQQKNDFSDLEKESPKALTPWFNRETDQIIRIWGYSITLPLDEEKKIYPIITLYELTLLAREGTSDIHKHQFQEYGPVLLEKTKGLTYENYPRYTENPNVVLLPLTLVTTQEKNTPASRLSETNQKVLAEIARQENATFVSEIPGVQPIQELVSMFYWGKVYDYDDKTGNPLQTKEKYHDNGSKQIKELASGLVHPTQPLPRKEEMFLEQGSIWTYTLYFEIYEGPPTGGVGCQRINCPYNWNKYALAEFGERLRQESIADIKEDLEMLEIMTDLTELSLMSSFNNLLDIEEEEEEGE